MAPVIVIGAGPGGLTAAHCLTCRGVHTAVLEQDDQVGGLAKTATYKGFRFDIGGHRFFTKVVPVQNLWRELLGPDLLKRPRLSRIYYVGRLFDYPLKATNVLRNLGPITSAQVLGSLALARARPISPEVSFEDWVCNRFGRRLFEMFFKSYTEKVWGLPCSRIAAEWAAQRIKGLSLWTAVREMLRGSKTDSSIKTLIHEFEYPRLGPGMMWEACRDRIERAGGWIELRSRVCGLRHDGSSIEAVIVTRGGVERIHPASHVISTMPIRNLIESMIPRAPDSVMAAAQRLKYRDFLTVVLIVDRPDIFPDNWIYVHDPTVRVGRIQNFKNWSQEMVPDVNLTSLGLEYFCSEGDDLWAMADADIIEMAKRELEDIGLVRSASVVDGCVRRVFKAYPVYEEGYVQALAEVRTYLDRFRNLQLVGRNGMHKYNNQDHSMLTAMLAAENVSGKQHDLWAVNADDEYHEEIGRSDVEPAAHLRRLTATQPLVPTSLPGRE